MKRMLIVLCVFVSLSLLCSCRHIESDNSSTVNKNDVPTDNEDTSIHTDLEKNDYSSLNTYAIYELFENNNESEFDKILQTNPIDLKMEKELEVIDLSGVREQQEFFNSYVNIWKTELEYSLDNLKQYLTKEEITELEATQGAWEQSMNDAVQFDLTLFSNKGIVLGTQCVASTLITTIDQYRERVFHVKYITMLVENSVAEPIPEEEQLWNKWSIG